MFDNDIGYVSFDPGRLQQDAWDDGYGDGMNKIINLVEDYILKRGRSLRDTILLERLLEYIKNEMPIRKEMRD